MAGSERDAAIQAARDVYRAESDATIDRRNAAYDAWVAADEAAKDELNAATKTLRVALLQIDREYLEEGR